MIRFNVEAIICEYWDFIKAFCYIFSGGSLKNFKNSNGLWKLKRFCKSIVMQISFVMLIFLLFSDQISGRKVAEGGRPPPPPRRKPEYSTVLCSLSVYYKIRSCAMVFLQQRLIFMAPISNILRYWQKHVLCINQFQARTSPPPRATPGVLHLFSARIPGICTI